MAKKTYILSSHAQDHGESDSPQSMSLSTIFLKIRVNKYEYKKNQKQFFKHKGRFILENPSDLYGEHIPLFNYDCNFKWGLKEECSAISALWVVQRHPQFFLPSTSSVFGSRKLIVRVLTPEVEVSLALHLFHNKRWLNLWPSAND